MNSKTKEIIARNLKNKLQNEEQELKEKRKRYMKERAFNNAAGFTFATREEKGKIAMLMYKALLWADSLN